jgi:hypothetical protein
MIPPMNQSAFGSNGAANCNHIVTGVLENIQQKKAQLFDVSVRHHLERYGEGKSSF